MGGISWRMAEHLFGKEVIIGKEDSVGSRRRNERGRRGTWGVLIGGG